MRKLSMASQIENELVRIAQMPEVKNTRQAYDIVCAIVGKEKRPAVRRVKGELVEKLGKILEVLNTS